jgi:hypothetical protein
MSHYRLKTKYNEEGYCGSTEEHTLYAHHNLSCDVVTFYDEEGRVLISIGDTIDNNLLDAINRLYAPFGSDLKLSEGVEHMNQDEKKKIAH